MRGTGHPKWPSPGATRAHNRASLLSQEQVQHRQKGPGLEAAILKVFIVFTLQMCILYDEVGAQAQRAWDRSSCRVSPPAASSPSWGDSAAGCAPTRWGAGPFHPSSCCCLLSSVLGPWWGLSLQEGQGQACTRRGG